MWQPQTPPWLIEGALSQWSICPHRGKCQCKPIQSFSEWSPLSLWWNIYILMGVVSRMTIPQIYERVCIQMLDSLPPSLKHQIIDYLVEEWCYNLLVEFQRLVQSMSRSTEAHLVAHGGHLTKTLYSATIHQYVPQITWKAVYTSHWQDIINMWRLFHTSTE